jgi:succinate-semialdehyde dehydrogenase/glutarate-semialdehyde dehydrogenase
MQDSIYDKFVDMVADRMRKVKVGNGLDDDTKMGPCINTDRLELAQGHVDDAVAKGASIICGGARMTDLPADLKNGFFFQPTLLKNATRDMRIFQEETFAPVLPMFQYAVCADADCTVMCLSHSVHHTQT